ncbi:MULTISPECIES: carbon-nitrogen hydrolase family protein [Pseudomonas]|uniref:(R)-stereoselective amidase n=1 Tax=Pseudomonas putida TaxID=303 RepID=A0A1B2F6M3_PSEPU|nr:MULTISPECIES: carbon-nitrogen hydrolase family protein [Pseudomonas]ANY87786.1 (R)-stereoselective amidase [Pseudomonas putida]MCL8304776.1 carbon-nitrogen hydrolase family protein [Pseudomonas putida]
MRVACSQFAPTLFAVASNCEHILRDMQSAAQEGVDLLVFPECALTGYVVTAADDLDALAAAEIEAALQSITLAAQNLAIHVIVGSLECVEGTWVNSCTFVDTAGNRQRQLKSHLPNIGADRFISAGNAPPRLYQVGEFKLGIMICYEARFPEIARSLALEGADILVHPTNLPSSSGKIVDFILPVRAMENHVYVMSANRTGVENDVVFLGQSKIFDTAGDISANAEDSAQTLIYATLCLSRARNKTLDFSRGAAHSGVSDIYNDRRPELYSASLVSSPF